MITISKERYEQLLKSERFLECLEACGVDNWCCYCDAHELMNEESED